MPINVEFNENERQDFTVTPTKLDGSPGQIEAGSLTVATQSGPAEGVVLSDGEVRVRAMGAPGASSLLLTADADLGEGVQLISEVFEVNAAALLATNLGVQPSGPAEVDPEL